MNNPKLQFNEYMHYMSISLFVDHGCLFCQHQISLLILKFLLTLTRGSFYVWWCYSCPKKGLFAFSNITLEDLIDFFLLVLTCC